MRRFGECKGNLRELLSNIRGGSGQERIQAIDETSDREENDDHDHGECDFRSDCFVDH